MKNGDIDKFKAANRDVILESYQKERESLFRKEDAKKLQDSLNLAIKNNQKNYEKLIDKIIIALDNDLYNRLAQIDGLVERKGATFKIAFAEKYNEEVLKIAKDFDLAKDGDDIIKIQQRINGALNKLRGDIFENFLAVVFNQSEQLVGNLQEKTIEELIDYFCKGFSNNKNIKITKDKSYEGIFAKVVGQEVQDSISLKIDSKEILISGSQGKTDVQLLNLDGSNLMGISAKSYGSGDRKISILSKANIASLISSWPAVNDDIKNLALNGLSSKSEVAQQYNLIKKIFMIQGLMGADNRSILSEMFIINRNTEENPILILSMYDLLFTDNLKGDFSKIEPINYKKGGRTPEQFINFIKNSTISIHTQLSINKLAEL